MGIRMASMSVPMVYVAIVLFMSNNMHLCLADSGSSSSGNDTIDYTAVDDAEQSMEFLFGLVMLLVMGGCICCYCTSKDNCVLVLQVACRRMGGSLQEELRLTARRTSTIEIEGIRHILQVSTHLLLNNINHCFSACTSVYKKLTDNGELELMKQLSYEEQKKFDVETIINIDGIASQQSYTPKVEGSSGEEFIVVTILVSLWRSQRSLPIINDTNTLKEALFILKSIQTTEIADVKVLWTPQMKNNSMSEQGLKQKYPNLRLLQKPH